MASIDSKFLDLEDARIHYAIAGEGSPIVFIHGFACDLTMWEPQVSFFSKQFQTLRYDARGFGASSLPGDASYGHYHDLALILEHLNMTPAYVVGLSRGGSIALNFAITYPHHVRKLVLAGASPGPNQATKVHDSGPNEGYHLLLELARKEGIPAAKTQYANSGIFSAAQTNPEVLSLVHQMLSTYSGWHFLNNDPQVDPDPPAHEQLANIKAPTLAIVGSEDVPLFHKLADMVETQTPNATKVIIPGSGHMVNLEAIEQFNNVVLDFLEN